MIDFLFIYLSILFFFLVGNISLKKVINKNISLSKICIKTLNGIILVSFTSFALNFFLPLNEIINTFFFLIPFIFFLKRLNYNRRFLLNVFYISLFSLIILLYAKSNRPDAGIYHYPFVSILNNEKINIGLTNIHSHYGLTSIIQYLQGFLNNFIFSKNGMLYPLSIIPSCVFLYFYCEIFGNLRKKIINKKYVLFNLFCLVFFTYKMNRYGEYGNDYIGHYIIFFLISLILKYRKKLLAPSILFYSSFIFMNKLIFAPIMLLPFLLSSKKNFIKIVIIKKNLFIFLLIFLWMLKNLLLSGCFLWPVKYTCVQSLPWYNNNHISSQNVDRLSTIIESWSKGWPDQKNLKLDFKNYNKNFNWIDTWISNHAIKIFLIYIPFIIFCLIFIIFFNFKNYEKDKRPGYLKLDHIDIKVILIMTFSIMIWFFKVPTYRFGISFIAITIIFFILSFLKNYNISSKSIISIKYLSISLVIIFISKNLIKFQNYKNQSVYKLPRIYSFEGVNIINKNNYTKVKVNNFYYFKPKKYCMYVNFLCSNEDLDANLKVSYYKNYKIYMFK